MKLGDYVNPFSTAHRDAREHFTQLSGWSKLGVVLGTAFAAIISAPFLGVGGVVAFKALSEYAWSKKPQVHHKVSETSKNVLYLETKKNEVKEEPKVEEQSQFVTELLESANQLPSNDQIPSSIKQKISTANFDDLVSFLGYSSSLICIGYLSGLIVNACLERILDLKKNLPPSKEFKFKSDHDLALFVARMSFQDLSLRSSEGGDIKKFHDFMRPLLKNEEIKTIQSIKLGEKINPAQEKNLEENLALLRIYPMYEKISSDQDINSKIANQYIEDFCGNRDQAMEDANRWFNQDISEKIFVGWNRN